jgi:hypothetical protein
MKQKQDWLRPVVRTPRAYYVLLQIKIRIDVPQRNTHKKPIKR